MIKTTVCIIKIGEHMSAETLIMCCFCWRALILTQKFEDFHPLVLVAPVL